jgi:hypothetical protein
MRVHLKDNYETIKKSTIKKNNKPPLELFPISIDDVSLLKQ